MGCNETVLKTRFNNHKQSFVHRHKKMPRNCRRLSGMPKTQEKNPTIEWRITAETSPYQPGAKSCNLCLAEKLAILQSNPGHNAQQKIRA